MRSETAKNPGPRATAGPGEAGVAELMARMTLAEKAGQLSQLNGGGGHVPHDLGAAIRAGRVGAVLNEVDVETVNELQRIAVEESRLGIPLLVGRDVIHGFRTVFPIPLGLASSWNPEVLATAARISAAEAAAAGVNWTFAPMVDIGRDPRWGRIAECLGEDPHLSSVLAVALVRGFQGDDLATPGRIAACAKHFAGYGASEAGKDYNTTSIPEIELRNVHLPPFEAAVKAGVATLMTSFSDLNGVPATANHHILTTILREEWGFDGLVVSDWESIPQLAVHGLTDGDASSAAEAANAGVDMEMASTTYVRHLEELVAEGRVSMQRVDAMVANVLRVKMRLGLFEEPFTDPALHPEPGNRAHLDAAHSAALESIVLVKNRADVLPLQPHRLARVAVVGPLADDGFEQLGTWIFDGDPSLSRTPLDALRDALRGVAEVRHARGVETTRSRGREGFDEAVATARDADVVLAFLGEESILSGEAHCRADVSLPGAQEALLRELHAAGKPIVLVLMAGRPLALASVEPLVDAILVAWHPGTMAGPALADLLLGVASPSGKLPVTFPKVTGQIPVYYARKNTGKPATPESMIHIDEIRPNAPQLSIGNTSFHLDAGDAPLFPFGHGLSYTRFEYSDLRVEGSPVPVDGALVLSVRVANVGERDGEEVVQLYVRDPVASVTRPVRELKGFRKVRLAAGEERTVTFVLETAALAFHGRDMIRRTEPGRFQAWIGGTSEASLMTEFEVLPSERVAGARDAGGRE